MTTEHCIAEIRALSDRVTKRKPAGMTEQGQKGLLWTLFDGDVGARRICSAANPDDARFIQSLYEHREELLTLAAECLKLREDKERLEIVMPAIHNAAKGLQNIAQLANVNRETKRMIEALAEAVNLHNRQAIDKARQALDAAKEAK